MNNKSVIKNPARLRALLIEKIAYYKTLSPGRFFRSLSMEEAAKERRFQLLNTQKTNKEKQMFTFLTELVVDKKLSIYQAAKFAGTDTVTFKYEFQAIIERNMREGTNNTNLESTDKEIINDSELKPIIMDHIEDGYSIPVIAAYTSKTVEEVEEITGLKSEVSQLEYDIINDLLYLREDDRKEVILATLIDLIYEGVLDASEAAELIRMPFEDFLNESGLNDKCSSDGTLMIRTNTDKIIDNCMNCLVSNVNTTDLEIFYYLIKKNFYNLTKWLDDHFDETDSKENNTDYDNSYDDEPIEGFDIYKVLRDSETKGFKEGREIGIAENRISTARNLLASGVSDDIIINCTGIDSDEFEKIKAETEKN